MSLIHSEIDQKYKKLVCIHTLNKNAINYGNVFITMRC